MSACPIKLHEGGQADAGAHHVGGKGMSKAMGIGEFDAGGLAMMAEQRTQIRPGSCAARARVLSEKRTTRRYRDRAVPAAGNDRAVERFREPAAESEACCLCRARGVAPSESSTSSGFRAKTSADAVLAGASSRRWPGRGRCGSWTRSAPPRRSTAARCCAWASSRASG